MEDDLMNLDLYELIGAAPTASTKEIKTSYRKKALSCHPDKNPDNPRAPELFLQLSRVLEVLIDDSARAAYDKVFNARKQAKLRITQLDSKRRKFKEDLEAREEAYRRSQVNTAARSDEQKLKDEIERLKKEGSRQVEEEVAFVKQKIYEQLHSDNKGNVNGIGGRIKIKWKADKNDDDNGGYNYEILHNILSKYGDISVLIISNTKKGSGLVEYKEKSAAIMATQIEMGLAKNPLSLQGLWQSNSNDKQTKSSENKFSNSPKLSTNIFPSTNQTSCDIKNNLPSYSSAPDIFQTMSMQNNLSDVDFENSVLNNMRRVEERKRLLAQMKAAEDET
ncbi:hypothetical protein PV325_008912 [Microctonus aethiopoides]|uniref:J domain-containing protein n=1 Tax=Microctonus aethiopoides TaxID=144406 RepID=A0AA39F099_9HYME|nr:hypothetical protein PV325_008912 [Microctonus aethiopoides]KAK0157708.1 hypothetical protein PV328_011412 [Microctonus aethiopoides]